MRGQRRANYFGESSMRGAQEPEPAEEEDTAKEEQEPHTAKKEEPTPKCKLEGEGADTSRAGI